MRSDSVRAARHESPLRAMPDGSGGKRNVHGAVSCGCSSTLATNDGKSVRLSTVISKLLGINSLRVQDVHFAPDGLVIKATPSWRKPRCGRCTRRGPTY